MTVLTACQEAAKLLRPGQTVPTSVFSSTDTFAVELAALSTEAARAIGKAHDWRKLTTLKTHTGDGTTTQFALPADYDRMPVKAAVFSTSYMLPMESVHDLDEWMDRELRSFVGSIGYWMILGGYIQIKGSGGEAMPSTESAKYYYISSYLATGQDGVNKSQFTADTDTFRLPERLLTLELIWRWRHRKGLDYAEDMRNSEIARSEEAGRDKGSRIIKVGRSRVIDGLTPTYPGSINAS